MTEIERINYFISYTCNNFQYKKLNSVINIAESPMDIEKTDTSTLNPPSTVTTLLPNRIYLDRVLIPVNSQKEFIEAVIDKMKERYINKTGKELIFYQTFLVPGTNSFVRYSEIPGQAEIRLYSEYYKE